MTSFSELARILELKTEFDEIMEQYHGTYLSIPCPRYLTIQTAEFFDSWRVGQMNFEDQNKLSEISRKFLELYSNLSKYATHEGDEHGSYTFKE